jgi:putative transposase
MRTTRPRLDPALYVGFQRVFLTFCTSQRAEYFAAGDVVDDVMQQILPVAADSRAAILAYCFMPDHLHLLIEGESESTDALAFVHQAKQRSGFAFSQRRMKKLWQPSYYDRVLRDDEAAISVARYIVENPVRARLVESPGAYPYLGSPKYTMEEILAAVCWQP